MRGMSPSISPHLSPFRFPPPHSATKPSWTAPRDERRWPSKTFAGSTWCRRPGRATAPVQMQKKGPWFAWKKLTNKFKKQSTSELKLPNVSAIPSTGYSFIVACLLESLGCLMLFTSIWYIYIYPTHPNTKKWLFVVTGWLVHPFSTSSSHPILPRFWSLGSSPKGAQARLQRWKTAGNGRDFGIAWLPAKC